MNSDQWKTIAEFVGISAIVASLIFVGLQLRQDSAIAARESSSDFVAAGVEMAQLFSDNRDVWRRGLDGESLADDEQITFDALVRVFFLDRRNRFARRELEIDAFGAPDIVARYTAFYLYQYPGLRQAYERQMSKIDSMNRAIDGPEASQFRLEVMRMLEQFDKNPPELPDKDYIVF